MTAESDPRIGAPGYPPAQFSIAVETGPDAVTVAPKGELDLATVGQFQHKLRELIDAGAARIVIDLRGVEFLDSTGLHALITVHAQAQQSNWELTIIPGPHAVQRVFEITSTLDRLPFTTSNGRSATRPNVE